MLSDSILRTLSQALVELHRPGIDTDFPNRLFACLRFCFFCDFYSYDERTENDTERIEIYPALNVNVGALGRWLNRRPNVGGIYKHNGSLRIVRSPAPPPGFRSELHHDLLGLLGQTHHLGIITLAKQTQQIMVPFAAKSRGRSGPAHDSQSTSVFVDAADISAPTET